MAEDEDLVPELGDWVTFLSNAYKTTTGRIIYRDAALIRIRPTQSSHTAVDFPLDPDTGLFLDTLGVQEILIHEKRKDPHFSVQLSVSPGEFLEFFTATGVPSREPAMVRQVIATANDDAIVLDSGEVLNFNFMGPTSPNDVLRPRAAPDQVAPPENNGVDVIPEEELKEEEVFPEIDYALLPAALVEEIPTEERTYSDSVQREDMFISLLVDVPEKKQRDPKIMQNLYRVTDLLLAMKNSLVVRDEGGAVLSDAEPTSYIANTLQDVVEKSRSGDTIRAFLPVMAVKKVLYTDDADINRHFESDDTQARSDVGSLIGAANSNYPEEAVGNGFVSYLHSVLQAIVAYVPATSSSVLVPYDMDVLRSEVPPAGVIGFPKTPPAVNKKGVPQFLGVDSLGTIKNRYVRLLTDTRLRDHKTQTTYIVAPADSGNVRQYIMLSNSLLPYRAPTRSSVLVWDIEASELSRSRRISLYPAMMADWASQDLYDPATLVELADTLGERLSSMDPADITEFQTHALTTLLDAFGLRTLEISTTAFDPVSQLVNLGLDNWDMRFETLTAATKQSVAMAQTYAIPPLLPASSALLSAATLQNPVLQPVVTYIQTQETLLKTYDFAIVQGILSTASSTLGRYYSAICGAVDADLQAALERTYKAEVERLNRTAALVLAYNEKLKAEPDINPCPHVKQLERIMNIRNDDQRMLLLNKFLNEYQAGQRGNYFLCGHCGQDLLCKHEVLLLYEFLHPGRGQSLHKSLLLEYAGPVYEGAYICKTCGQKIQELEYDTHLEFDDEGRPLVGRSVLANEEDDDTAPIAVLREDAAEAIPFTGADLALYYVARTLFEACGYSAPMDTYQRVIPAAQDFLKLRVPDKENYSRLREAATKTAKRGAPLPPPYSNFFANYEIGVLGGLAVLELQTSGAAIPFPFTGCPFVLSGFPLDTEDPTAGPGAVGGVGPAAGSRGTMAYVACVIANTFRNDAPWNLTSWSPETNMAKRQAMSENAVKLALFQLLCIPNGKITPPPLTGVTDTYNELLKAARRLDIAEIKKPSETDVLPTGFRPLAQPSAEVALTDESVQNVKKYQADVMEGQVAKILPFAKKRLARLTGQLMEQFNKESQESGVIVEGSPRSDSVCCFGRLGSVAKVGLGVASLHVDNLQKELELQGDAVRILEQRDTARANSGTHIYIPWSAHVMENVLPEVDPAAYYRIFMQYCYRGRRHGALHELNTSGVCRWCRFIYPAELTYLTPFNLTDSGSAAAHRRALEEMARSREEIATGALRAQAIAFDEPAFRVLEMAMKNQKAVVAGVGVEVVPLEGVLAILGGTLTMVMPAALDEWRVLSEAWLKMSLRAVTDKERTFELVEFSKLYDLELASLLTKMTTGLGTKGCDKLVRRIGSRFEVDMSYRGAEGAAGAATDVLVGLFDAVCAGPDSNLIIQNLVDVFVTQASQISNGFTILTPRSNKWFPRISRNHKTLLDTIWSKSYSVVTQALLDMKDLSAETQDIVRTSLNRFSGWFGVWLSVLHKEIRMDVHLSPSEFKLFIQWSLFTGLQALMTESSPFYADATDSTKKLEAVRFHIGWVCDAMIDQVLEQAKYQKTAAEVTEAINARAELEKAYFIKRFDDLDKDLRDIEKRKKALKIGDWAVGTLKNLFSYDADFFEFERGQRVAMGLPDFAEGITGVQELEPRAHVEREEGYDHRAPIDEDID